MPMTGRWTVGIVAAGMLVVGCGGGEGGGNVGPMSRIPASVEIGPAGAPLVAIGATVLLTATVRDQDGSPIAAPSVAWSTPDPEVVGVSGTGLVVARGNGIGAVVATAGQVADTVTITVAQATVGVRLFPLAPVLELPGDTVTVTGTPVDSRGNVVADAGPVSWSATGVISVGASGLIEAEAFGAGTITAMADGASSSATVEVLGDRYFLSQGTRLRYTLDLPGGPGPFPAIVFVHGSGQVNRNTQRDATDPFVPEGVAILRYDKRGVGESGGTYQGVSVSNSGGVLGLLAEDAANGVRFLAKRSEIDPDRIGLLGNSQGGWIVPMAAQRAPEHTAFILLWSGPTVSVGLEIFYSNLAEGTTTPLDAVYAQLPAFQGPNGYESLPDIAGLDIPGMWQYGELDRSIPMRLDVDRLNTLRGQGRRFEVVTWAFGDHALRDVRVGQFYDVWAEYLRFLRDIAVLSPAGEPFAPPGGPALTRRTSTRP